MAGIEAITGHPAGPACRSQFQQYLDLFLRWNRTYRMTALDSPAAVVRELFADSLLFLPLLPVRRPLAIADLGAGAGIPGLALRIADPRLAVTLVESRRKRVSFLRTVCRELGLDDVTVREGRAEQLVDEAPTLAAGFDIVVARSVGPAGALRALALKYLKPGGSFIASAPPDAAPRSGLEPVRVRIPWSKGTRTFLRAAKES